MRLRRVEAVRYGALAGASLGELGDGLTVIHGPNEAGKSTYTSLVRHVLYGYPTLRETDPGYHVPGEGRCARLVFDDEQSAWVIERAEAVRGGAVSVRSLNGDERPRLLEDLVQGVSAGTFKTVFAFGLDELAAIEAERGREDSIIARLYAAGAGLRVNPQEVRAAIEREAAELFKPSGRKQPVSERVAEVRQVRTELRDLRAQSEAFLDDQERLRVMEQDLEVTRSARDAARERVTELAVALERAEERLAVIAAEEEARPALLRERAQLQAEAEGLNVNEPLLSVAHDIEAVLEDAAGHARALQALDESEAAVARARVREADAIERSGLSTEALEALDDTPDALAVIEEAREDLQRLQLQCESRDEGVQRATAEADKAAAERDRLCTPLGITVDPAEAIAERLSAIEAVESLRGGASVRRGPDTPAIILLISGLVAAAAGAALQEWLTAAIGVVLAIAGAVFVLRASRGVPSPVDRDDRQYLRMLGLESDAGPLELNRARRALEQARAAQAAQDEAVRALDEASREAALGCDALQTRRTLWAEWLSERNLDPTLSPSGAAAILALAREARNHRAQTQEAEHAHEKALGALDSFAAKFGETAGSFLGLTEAPTRDEVPALAIRLKELLAEARMRGVRREEIARLLATLEERIAAERDRGARARDELLEVLARFDLADGGRHEDLLVLHGMAVRAEGDASAAYDALAQAKHQLEGRLENVARDNRIGELHVREAGIVERLGAHIDRYLVLAAASRLLAEAQARYQRERQPDVVRRAGEYFATITGGRYVGLTMPLGDGRIEVFDTRAGARTSDILSRGTAEQLYLAVRLGLISQLGDVGRHLPVLMDDVLVNFDPERRMGAAKAVAELAESRQVLFFTCHPDTARIFAEIAPQHVRLELPRLS